MFVERRAFDREVTAFKAAYLLIGDRMHFVTLKNISEYGVKFAGCSSVKVGDKVRFGFDPTRLCEGVVRWVEGGSFGIQTSNRDAYKLITQSAYPLRSLRLPVSADASLFLDGRETAVQIMNLSIRGMCIRSHVDLSPNMEVSIFMNGYSFEGATVRWVDRDRAGIRFATPVSGQEICKITESCRIDPRLPGSSAETKTDGGSAAESQVLSMKPRKKGDRHPNPSEPTSTEEKRRAS